MTKKIRFVRDVYVDGAKAHAIGEERDASPENERHVRRGNAVEVEATEPKAEPKAKKKN